MSNFQLQNTHLKILIKKYDRNINNFNEIYNKYLNKAIKDSSEDILMPKFTVVEDDGLPHDGAYKSFIIKIENVVKLDYVIQYSTPYIIDILLKLLAIKKSIKFKISSKVLYVDLSNNNPKNEPNYYWCFY